MKICHQRRLQNLHLSPAIHLALKTRNYFSACFGFLLKMGMIGLFYKLTGRVSFRKDVLVTDAAIRGILNVLGCNLLQIQPCLSPDFYAYLYLSCNESIFSASDLLNYITLIWVRLTFLMSRYCPASDFTQILHDPFASLMNVYTSKWTIAENNKIKFTVSLKTHP